MSRISIEVTSEEHQKLKTMAASRGQSIKDYVIERTLGAGKSHGSTESRPTVKDDAARII